MVPGPLYHEETEHHLELAFLMMDCLSKPYEAHTLKIGDCEWLFGWNNLKEGFSLILQHV